MLYDELISLIGKYGADDVQKELIHYRAGEHMSASMENLIISNTIWHEREINNRSFVDIARELGLKPSSVRLRYQKRRRQIDYENAKKGKITPDSSVRDLELSVRVYNAIYRGGFTTIRELIDGVEDGVILPGKVRGVGEAAFVEILNKLLSLELLRRIPVRQPSDA